MAGSLSYRFWPFVIDISAGIFTRSNASSTTSARQTTGRFASVSTGVQMADIAGVFAVSPAFGATDAVVFEVATANASWSFFG
ncbi:MAG: hypothetical protein F4Z86_12635 [Gemmatimonadetes bacterium]|nr:hypothetical protein [Gemmatimonadota bacterium]MYB58675.1 hypothetical protein [Gemmatimonadota bacterium]